MLYHKSCKSFQISKANFAQNKLILDIISFLQFCFDCMAHRATDIASHYDYVILFQFSNSFTKQSGHLIYPSPSLNRYSFGKVFKSNSMKKKIQHNGISSKIPFQKKTSKFFILNFPHTLTQLRPVSQFLFLLCHALKQDDVETLPSEN